MEPLANHYQQFASSASETTPAKLRSRKHAAAYYGMVREPPLPHLAGAAANGQNTEELSADIAIRLKTSSSNTKSATGCIMPMFNQQ